MSDLAELVLLAMLKQAIKPTLKVAQCKGLSGAQMNSIASGTSAAFEKVDNLSQICTIISLVMANRHSEYKWGCVASQDTDMTASFNGVDGFIKYSFGKYTFVVFCYTT